jgi:hypothetical protein
MRRGVGGGAGLDGRPGFCRRGKAAPGEEVPHPVKAIAEVRLPDRYGTPHSDLTLTVDFIVRTRLTYLPPPPDQSRSPCACPSWICTRFSTAVSRESRGWNIRDYLRDTLIPRMRDHLRAPGRHDDAP